MGYCYFDTVANAAIQSSKDRRDAHSEKQSRCSSGIGKILGRNVVFVVFKFRFEIEIIEKLENSPGISRFVTSLTSCMYASAEKNLSLPNADSPVSRSFDLPY